jgi:hypothetical protein
VHINLNISDRAYPPVVRIDVRTDGVLHDDDDGEHGPERGHPEAAEQRRDVVEHGHQRERQPHLERVRHPPRVLPRDLGKHPGEPEHRLPEPVQRRADPLPAADARVHLDDHLHLRHGLVVCLFEHGGWPYISERGALVGHDCSAM